MRTREALLAVLVRTRPWKRRQSHLRYASIGSVLTMVAVEDVEGLELDVDGGGEVHRQSWRA